MFFVGVTADVSYQCVTVTLVKNCLVSFGALDGTCEFQGLFVVPVNPDDEPESLILGQSERWRHA